MSEQFKKLIRTLLNNCYSDWDKYGQEYAVSSLLGNLETMSDFNSSLF